MSIVELEKVEVGRCPGVLRVRVDDPAEGSGSEVYSVALRGWAVGEDRPIESIECRQRGRTIVTLPVGGSRPGVGEEFPDADWAASSGFAGSIPALHLDREFELQLIARFGDGREGQVAKLSGTREPLPAVGGGRIQPLVVNTIGRSGSTWLLELLGNHPRIAAFAPAELDARVARYWASFLQDISRPESYLLQFRTTDASHPFWWTGEGVGAAPAPGPVGGGEVGEWLGRTAIEELGEMVVERIDAFYSRFGAPGEGFFVEKSMPHQIQSDLLLELYPGGREIVLVRDVRDTLASILAFNRKRGYAAFGRDRSSDDADYVRKTLGPSARTLLERWQRRRGERTMLLRYEDLVLAPRDTLAEILGFLGLPAEEREVEAVLDAAGREDKLREHRTSSDIASSVGRWRDGLSPELLEACAEVLDPVLRDFGYEETTAARGGEG